MELSTIIGKPVLSPAGERLGYVKNVYVGKNLDSVLSLGCIDDEEEEFYLPYRAVLSAEDAVIARPHAVSAPSGVPCPIGMAAYSHRGEALGIVTDLLFTDGGASVVVLRDGVRTPYDGALVSVGETAIVYPDGETKQAAAKHPPKKRTVRAAKNPPREESKPAKLPLEEPKPAEIPLEEPNPAGRETPPNDRTDGRAEEAVSEGIYRMNLLGRRVKRDVCDGQGFPIARTGEKVTPSVLREARRHNRLLELTVNTLTNIF